MVSKLPKHTNTLFKTAYQKKAGKQIETERQNMKREEKKNWGNWCDFRYRIPFNFDIQSILFAGFLTVTL